MSRPLPDSVTPNGKRYHIHTFGCQMNMADSERMAGALESVGYECVEDPALADVLVYNTCSIRCVVRAVTGHRRGVGLGIRKPRGDGQVAVVVGGRGNLGGSVRGEGGEGRGCGAACLECGGGADWGPGCPLRGGAEGPGRG